MNERAMESSLYQDRIFKNIVVGSTGLGLACMLGSVAATRISKDVGLEFGWHWSILIVATAVVFWNRRFWNLVWELQMRSTEGNRRKLAFHLGVLAFLGIGSFLSPIRFIEHSYWGGILKGLLTAGTFVGTMMWLIY